jgi:hypothetical protein
LEWEMSRLAGRKVMARRRRRRRRGGRKDP